MNNTSKKIRISIKLRRDLVLCIGIIILVFAAYWQLPKNNFISFDDDLYVTENVHLRNGFSFNELKWAFTTFHAFNWHPLVWLSHLMDYQLFGLNASMHHFMSLLFHMMNSLILFFILKLMSKDVWPSLFVALLFAIHPLHVESVAWVSERKDLLSAFFLFVTIWFYFRYTKKQRFFDYFMVFISYILGLMSKPMLVTLPFLLLLLDIWPIQRMLLSRDIVNNKKENPKKTIYYLVLEKIPLFILSAVSSGITFIAQKQGGMVRALQEFPVTVRLSNAIISYVRYIGKMVFPADLSFYYPYPKEISLVTLCAASIIIIFVTLYAIKKIKIAPFIVVGWFWFLGTLIPVIGLVQVATQSIADRYTYIPLIGLFIIIAWLGSDYLNKNRKNITSMIVVSIVIIIGCMTITWKQVRYWKNDIQLHLHAIDVTKNNPRSNYHLGVAYYKAGKIIEAISYYEEALRIKPNYLSARMSLGDAFLKVGKNEDAIRHYRYGLKLKKNNADGHFRLGYALMINGRLSEALLEYKKAIKINNDLADVHYNLGMILSKQQKYNDAVIHFKEVIRILPDDAEAYNNLGNLFFRMGKVQKALVYYRKAVILDPEYIVAKKNIESLLNGIAEPKSN